MSKTNPVCRVCGTELTDENWRPGERTHKKRICKECSNKQHRAWRKANPEKERAQHTRQSRKSGHLPINENRECPSFLGVAVAERVLSHVFKNVEQMPNCNPGYDFICGRGYKVDVKSGCLKQNGQNLGMWTFILNKNKIADYFLCIAFDNREKLNPLHLWLLPSAKFNDKQALGISLSTIHKWDEYALDISKVVSCCNIMKA